MPLYTFSCRNGHTFDALAGRTASSRRPCQQCDGVAEKHSVYQISHSGFTPTPRDEREIRMGAFNEASNELAYQHDRLVDATQNLSLPSPPLWQMAKARAKKLQRLGVKDSSQLKDVTI